MLTCATVHGYRLVGCLFPGVYAFSNHASPVIVPDDVGRDCVRAWLDPTSRSLMRRVRVPVAYQDLFPHAELHHDTSLDVCIGDEGSLRPGGWRLTGELNWVQAACVGDVQRLQSTRRIKSGVEMVTFVTAHTHLSHAMQHETWAKQWMPMAVRHAYSPTDLDKTWCDAHADIVYAPRGAGLWLWKPALVEAVLQTTSCEFLVYCDAGSAFRVPWSTIEQWFRSDGTRWCYATTNSTRECDYTAANVLSLLPAGSDVKQPQFAATAFVLRTASSTCVEFVRKWHERCTKREWIAAKEPHRQDQSLFSVTLKQMAVHPAAEFGDVIAHRVFYGDHTSSATLSELRIHDTLYVMHAPCMTAQVQAAFARLQLDVGSTVCKLCLDTDHKTHAGFPIDALWGADRVWWIESSVFCHGHWKTTLARADIDPRDFLATHVEAYGASNHTWYHWTGTDHITRRHKSFMALARLSYRLLRALQLCDWTAFAEMWVPTVACQQGMTVGQLPSAMIGSVFRYDHPILASACSEHDRVYNPVAQ